MKLRDISNKDISTLATCESEPIHLPGSIQPHGVLIAVDAENKIRFCSANCHEAFALSPSAILQKPLSGLNEELDQRIAVVRRDERSPVKPFLVTIGQKQWDVFVQQSEDLLLIELEQHVRSPYDSEDLFDQTRDFVAFIERSKSLQELCHRIAGQIRQLTGYDRVMIYRFDKEYNGQVYAESRHEQLEPYLDLHYPHTDIPVQARELYLRNLMRLIADVHYTPVPLLTLDEGPGNPNLSDSVLRSVSPIHIQYLKNMGVGATLTISLVQEGKLWGLIACHHRTAKQLSFAQRKAVLLQGHFLTSQIKVRQVAEEYDVHTVVEAHLQQLLNAVPTEGDFHLKFENFSSLLAVANATGAVILHKGKIYQKGLVPPSDKTKALLNWLAQTTRSHQFSTSHLQQHYPEAEKISRQAAGILYHKLGDPQQDAILWFREEIEQTINWAGNPHEAVRKTPQNGLSPRSSFALYQEAVRYHSREWKLSELNAASRFAGALQNQFHVEYILLEELKQRILNERLLKANEELSNINWITTHDLQEPLRKILLFSSKALNVEEIELSQSIIQSLTKIQKSAVRMQTLVNDIITYTLTDDKKAVFVRTDLTVLAQDVLSDYAEEFAEKGIHASVEDLPTLAVVPYQVRQLFVNLISNAIKYAKKTEPLRLALRCSKDLATVASQPLLDPNRNYFHLTVEDNGIGFDAAHNQKLFNIFYRLHGVDAYAGTGIGLAICKRIVENHSGLITASGKSGVGASFHIYLPETMA